jgi:serine phosphatase RsbU (regulator of sigma subunit)
VPEPDPTAAPPPGAGATTQALDELLELAHTAAPHELAGLIDRCARGLGADGAVVYLADLQQQVLVPFVGPHGPGEDEQLTALGVDSTLAGRAFQTVEVHTQDADTAGTHVWLPLLDGTERLGVLAVTVSAPEVLEARGGQLAERLRRLASLSADLLVAKTAYGDTLVRLRRRTEMGLAAEVQWALLPPLNFTSRAVTVAAALEPAYRVAGDTVDYAVDAGCTRFAVFDGMGHGLQSAQLASLSVAAYRNARRAGRPLVDTARGIDEALLGAFGGEVFTTAVLGQLDTDTGLVQWVNAGHPEPLLLRAGKLVKTLHSDPVLPLGLGYVQDRPVTTVGHEQLEPGDRVLLYTDGAVEARSPGGEFFGTDRLVDLVLRHLAGGLPAAETMRRVVRALLDHHQDQLSDDASLLMVEWRTDQEPPTLA